MEKADTSVADTSVNGFSTINHKIRVTLGLTMEEYAMIDFIFSHNLKKKREALNFGIIHKNIGIPKHSARLILKGLSEKKFIEKQPSGEILICKEWNALFISKYEKDFDNSDPNDPGIWQILKGKGNKQDAKSAYIKCRKIIDKDELHSKASLYIKSVSDEQYICHASTWLNPAKKNWENKIIIEQKSPEKKEKSYQKITITDEA